MPDSYKAVLDDLEADWSDIEAMSHQVFLDHLRKIELRDQKEKNAQEQLKKKYVSSPSDEGEVTEPSRKKKTKFYKKGDHTRKPSWQGEARACDLCKIAGMPQSKYRSHSTDQCKDKEQCKAKLSGNTADRQEAISNRKKDWKQHAKSESRRLEKAGKLIQ